MNKEIKIILISLLFFGIYFFVDEHYFGQIRKWFYEWTSQIGVSHILAYIIVGFPILVGTLLLHGRNKLFDSLGINKSVFTGVLFSLLCTSPMFLGFSIVFKLNNELSINTVLISIVAAGFFEELYFRGFLFGQLFRY
ncbi:MAG: CPBP family intramembrane glutamate endopeptidase, partial [Bacteroidota bacterium]